MGLAIGPLPEKPAEIYLNDAQWALLTSHEFEVLIGGAKRGGKTVGTAVKAIELLGTYPGNRGVVIRQDLPDLRDTWLPEFFNLCPPGFVVDHNKVERKITCRNGSVLLYMGAGNMVASKAAEKRKGLNVAFAIFEEATEIAETVYLMITAQFTWKLPDGTRPPYQAILSSNPEPGWVKRRFIGDLSSNTRPVMGTRFIPALPKDNAVNLPPGWEDAMRQTRPPDWVWKYLDGNWEYSEGMVFGEFRRETHCVDDFDFTGWKLLESLDHASTGITCWLGMAQDSDGNIIVLDEHYVSDKLVSQHSAMIHSKRNALLQRAFGNNPENFKRRENAPPVARFSLSLIDPSTLAKNQQTETGLQSIQEMYSQNGLVFSGAFNALEAGIERMKEYIHPNPFHRHPFTREIGAPMLYIVKGKCPNLEREIVELRKKVTDTGKVVYVGTDHALDNVRYVINAQPKPPERTRGDLAALPPQERRAVEMHSRWAKNFGKPASPNVWYPQRSR